MYFPALLEYGQTLQIVFERSFVFPPGGMDASQGIVEVGFHIGAIDRSGGFLCQQEVVLG